MRTTLDIDDDILAAAKELARAQGKTAGQVISDLARRALTTPSGLAELPQQPFQASGPIWHTLPDREGAVVTSDLVRQIEDKLAVEDATPWDHTTDQPRKF